MGRPRHDAVDAAERAQLMPYLLSAPSLSYSEVALFLDMPLATLDKLRAQGLGPRCFRMGRRLHVTRENINAWIAEMAKIEA